MVRMRGVTTMGVGWASGEASDLVGPPLNLVIYMHLRIFAYTSNTLRDNFEYMDCILPSDTLFFSFLVLIWMEGGHGTNEGGDNNGSRLVFWRSFQPRWTSAKSSIIHVFENVRVYIEYSHL